MTQADGTARNTIGKKRRPSGRRIALVFLCLFLAAGAVCFLLFSDTIRIMSIGTAPDLFNFLLEDESRFDSRWESARKATGEKGMTDEWNSLCGTVSALMDYLDDTDLMEMYDTTYPQYVRTDDPYLSEVRDTVVRGLPQKVKNAVYAPGHTLDLRGTVWISSRLEKRLKGLEPPERRPGDPVRIIVADASQEIADRKSGIVPILEGGKLIRDYHDDIHNRDNSIFSELFKQEQRTGRLWTAYPHLADVLLTITVNYPSAGEYSGGGTRANAHSCVIILKAENLHTGETKTEVFRNDPGPSISAGIGAKTVWMERPLISNRKEAASLADTIMSWFRQEE